MSTRWIASTIGAVCDVTAGQSPDGRFYNEAGFGLPFYQGKKEFGKRYIEPPTTWTTSVTKMAQAGDILMSVRAPVGPINVATDRICIGRGLAAIRAKGEIDSQFLYYGLLALQKSIRGTDGAVFSSISKKQIEALHFAYPPPPEQKRIVAILDEAFAAIETAIANTVISLERARELGIRTVRQFFANGGSDWTRTRIGEQVLLQRGFDITKKEQQLGDVPVVSSGGVKSYHSVSKAQGPGVVIGRKGSIGSVYWIETDYWPHDTTLFVKDFKGNIPKLIYYLFESLELKRLDTGTANPALNRNLVHPIEILLPPKNQQTKVIAHIDSIFDGSEQLERIQENKHQRLSELKQSLLHKAFTGELTAHPKAVERELVGAGV